MQNGMLSACQPHQAVVWRPRAAWLTELKMFSSSDCILRLYSYQTRDPWSSYARNTCRVSGQAEGWLVLAKNCLPPYP